MDFETNGTTPTHPNGTLNNILGGKRGPLNQILSEWQIEHLASITSSSGIKCLLKMWLTFQANLTEGTYCNATWDNHYCWPPTLVGTIATRNCSEVLRESHPQYASYLTGNAFRVCQKDGTWLKGDWTNYTECADSYDEYVEERIMQAEENDLKEKVRYTVFIGSILSLVCLFSAISIFCCFRSIWCDRIIIHSHLMAALMLRYVLLYVITEPFIFNRSSNYRDEDWICKSVLIIYLYATLSSVNWMFIQGIYLNSKLTTNVFDKEPPFKLYYTFGWLVPLPFTGIYAILMEVHHPVKCWKGYSEMTEIWIVLGPILIDLLINACFLINILRILLSTINRAVPYASALEFKYFRRASKATVILTPILGLNNLLFIYNPGGVYHKYFVLLNTFFGSTQGVFVALVYCFLSSDVWSAFRRVYRRFKASRGATGGRSHHRMGELCSASSTVNFARRRSNSGRKSIPKTNGIISSTASVQLSSTRSQRPTNLQVFYKKKRRNSADDIGLVSSSFRQKCDKAANVSKNYPKRNPLLSPVQHETFSGCERKTIVSSNNIEDIPMCELQLQKI